jgi:hypothetical protein
MIHFHKWLKFDDGLQRGCLICNKIQMYLANGFDVSNNGLISINRQWNTLRAATPEDYHSAPYRKWHAAKEEQLKNKGNLTLFDSKTKEGALELI